MCKIGELPDRLKKLFRFCVVGVTAELLAAPCRVVGIGFRLASPAEIWEMNVLDFCLGECTGKCFLVELWIPPGTGVVANVGKELNVVMLQDRDELIDGAD